MTLFLETVRPLSPMLSPLPFKSLVVLTTLAAVGLGLAQDQGETSSTPAEDTEAVPEESPPDEEEIPVEMEELFPIGRAFFGVRIPNYDGDALTSLIRAKKMRRVDENHLDMEDLYITIFNDVGEPETFIEMERAVYDRIEEKLVSRTPTRIWQPQYEMKGDSMIYDAKTKIMTMKRSRERQVEMTIFGGGGALPGATFLTDDDSSEELPSTPTPLSPSSI